MELKEFIRETLEQIIQGVSAASAVVEKHGGTINPHKAWFRRDGQTNQYNSGVPHDVEFDVGLTSFNKNGSTEGIGVFLGSVNLGKKNDTGSEQTAVTRVRFSIPLVLPKGGSQNDEEPVA